MYYRGIPYVILGPKCRKIERVKRTIIVYITSNDKLETTCLNCTWYSAIGIAERLIDGYYDNGG